MPNHIVQLPIARNAHQWRAIAYFLAGFEQLSNTHKLQVSKPGCAAHGKRSAGAAQAGFSAIPDGNHGDNRILHK